MYVNREWFTGEFYQKVEPGQLSQRRRSGKLPDATQRAVDDINRRFPGELNDDLPTNL